MEEKLQCDHHKIWACFTVWVLSCSKGGMVQVGGSEQMDVPGALFRD